MQVYDQIYNNFDPNKQGVGSAPNATNYTSPILHSAILPSLKPNTGYGVAHMAHMHAGLIFWGLQAISRWSDA